MRLHTTYIRPRGVAFEPPHRLLDDIFKQGTHSSSKIEELIMGKHILKEQTIGIGPVAAKHALDYSFGGIMLRGSRIVWDLRKVAPNDKYDEVCDTTSSFYLQEQPTLLTDALSVLINHSHVVCMFCPMDHIPLLCLYLIAVGREGTL
ncbi:uncharacterized protein LACBIDRAFT_310215 [Laccaria bicolor S238N-H82]|uniref:Predicted protein n=1 Tax=Laccaria bicolor (strain S238N-H82 / ATCC MYA-4686) TaxID=486041 RepID=B0DTQ7_LACBS|nr:uncharacterized protein LACBIDRAFT_310215 [Laccaria bicolor S238N-H82]EDR01953.1 predicted protein [Laccaria bicolor S238N-H82]|eukprot:XP_001887344.1 predicted protein [Laccaria bicolor S238N-H82]